MNGSTSGLVVLAVLTMGMDGGTERATVRLRVSGLEDARGVVECVLWAGSNGFPRETTKALTKTTARPVGTEATCVFEELPPGRYAISFIHDRNEDGKMNTGLFGMPLERYGFSRDPKPFMRAPTFDEAAFQLEASSELSATAR